jgi:hypothetical protein
MSIAFWGDHKQFKDFSQAITIAIVIAWKGKKQAQK